MYGSRDRLILFDADGTTVDAFSVIRKTFATLGMEIGDLERFQKRRNLLKYIGGLKEFPLNLRRQLGKRNRQQLLDVLTECYREEGQLYPGVAELFRTLLATPGTCVGLVSRNVTLDPETSLRRLFQREGIDTGAFHYFACVPLKEEKSSWFRDARERLAINPARTYACGDEHKDYVAAVASGIHPFIVSYGFEDHRRLTRKFEVPEPLVSTTPAEFCGRVRHALDLPEESPRPALLRPHPAAA